MRRRDVIAGLLLATGLDHASAQSPAKAAHLAAFATSGSMRDPECQALWDGLHELGYREGRNITIEFRSGEGNFDRLPALAAEVVALKPDVIVAAAPPAALALKPLTRTIPVVFKNVSDPVSFGLVDSLAHPGGNFTGVSNSATQLIAKQLQLLGELVPDARKIAVLGNPDNPYYAQLSGETARKRLG